MHLHLVTTGVHHGCERDKVRELFLRCRLAETIIKLHSRLLPQVIDYIELFSCIGRLRLRRLFAASRRAGVTVMRIENLELAVHELGRADLNGVLRL